MATRSNYTGGNYFLLLEKAFNWNIDNIVHFVLIAKNSNRMIWFRFLRIKLPRLRRET